MPKLNDFLAAFRREHADLFATYDEIDSTGCRICRLRLRADVASTRGMSRSLYHKCGPHDRANYVAWLLLGNRMYDPVCTASVVTPCAMGRRKDSASLREFNLDAVRGVRKELKEYNKEASRVRFGTPSRYAEFESKQCKPMGSAGAHSGHAFLEDLASSAAHVKSFVELAQNLSGVLFRGHDDHHNMGDDDDMMTAIRGTAVIHASRCYNMSMFRVACHCIKHSVSNKHSRWPRCPDSVSAWERFLEYEGGAKSGAEMVGLIQYDRAVAFCTGMRRQLPNYCLCDLACWLCLARGLPVRSSRKRKRRGA